MEHHIITGEWAYEPRRKIYTHAKIKDTYKAICTLKNARNGRREENVASLLCCFVDIDGGATLQAIIDCLRLLELPLPLIINTSEGHFQLKWYLTTPVKYDKKSRAFKVWRAIQKALLKALAQFEVDAKVQLDVTRLLRNEHAKGIYNCKHHEPFLVKVVEQGELADLTTLRKPLEKHGFLEWPKKPEKVSIKKQTAKIMKFFIKSPLRRITQNKISQETGVPSRTTKFILAEKEHLFDKQIVGQGGRDRAILYRYKPAFLRYFKPIIRRVHKKDIKDLNIKLKTLVARFKETKIAQGSRNWCSFVASVALNVLHKGKMTVEQAINELRPGFECSNSGDKSFTWEQFCRTVASGMKPDRHFSFSNSNLQAWGLI